MKRTTAPNEGGECAILRGEDEAPIWRRYSVNNASISSTISCTAKVPSCSRETCLPSETVALFAVAVVRRRQTGTRPAIRAHLDGGSRV